MELGVDVYIDLIIYYGMKSSVEFYENIKRIMVPIRKNSKEVMRFKQYKREYDHFGFTNSTLKKIKFVNGTKKKNFEKYSYD